MARASSLLVPIAAAPLLGLLIAPCAHALAEARAGHVVMGTVLDVIVVAADDETARALAARSVEVAKHWDDVLTTWRAEGELARLNAQAGKGRVAISVDLKRALERMITLSRATGGLFEPAVGGVVSDLRSGAPRAPSRIAPMIETLDLGEDGARIDAGTQLDSGGIGKGIALDAIGDELRSRGAVAWFLNFGGSSQLAHGSPRTGDDWKVAVAGVDARSVHGFVPLRESSLSTSRSLPAHDPAGVVVDPRSGAPVEPPRLATVLAPDATTAEAWSKALLILGRDGLEPLRAAGLQALYEDASGVVTTPDFPLTSRTLAVRPAPRSE